MSLKYKKYYMGLSFLITLFLMLQVEHLFGQGRWNKKNNFSGKLQATAVSFVIDNQAYVGTGDGDFSERQQSFWAYNPEKDE